jgi:hypothetical protein
MKSLLSRNYLLLLFFLSEGLVFSQGNNRVVYANNPDSVIIFETTNKITIYRLDLITGNEMEKHGNYTMLMKHGVPFINVTWENKATDDFIMLSNSIACFLYKDPDPYMFGFSGGYNRGELVFRTPEDIKASSSLAENGKSYSPDQINLKLGQAWAEGVRGQGLHEKLFITQPNCTAVHISIGFVSFTKPYLYQENSRPKVINVSVEEKFSFTVDLLDTPNFQTIILPQELGATDQLVIEILDVYPGTKYEDTCINCILYDIAPMNKNHNVD